MFESEMSDKLTVRQRIEVWWAVFKVRVSFRYNRFRNRLDNLVGEWF